MLNELYVGVDGGASKCTIRLEDRFGNLIARTKAGPANIRISVEQSWHSILQTLEQMLTSARVPKENLKLKAGIGIAGCEIKGAYQKFIHFQHPFAQLQVVSDAHIACLGAHAGEDGAIIIIGTGVVGYAIAGDHIQKVSGWGFPHDDLGGGAWLGLEATKQTLQYIDKRAAESLLSYSVLLHFKNEVNQLVEWANQANSTEFATLAPLVIEASQKKDAQAIRLLQQAAELLMPIADVFPKDAPIALMGGIAPFLTPYFSPAFQNRCVDCKMSPEEGAILLARRYKD